jgi:hypothetical protein
MTHILNAIAVSHITDVTDVSKALALNYASATMATATTINIAQTADRTWSIPDASSTFLGTDVTQTVTNKTVYEPSSVTISAAGTNQATATGLTAMYNVVTTVAASTGVRLPVPTQSGLGCTVVNRGANTLNIYPASGAAIDGGAANAAVTLAANATFVFESSSATQWYSVGSFGVGGGGGGAVSSVSGTTNQVTATPSTGAVTLSTPTTFLAPGTIQDTTGMLYSTTNGVAAAGTIQSTATALTTSYVIVTSATTGSAEGVRLPVPTTGGLRVVIVNRTSSVVFVWPATGGQIDALGVNVKYGIAINAVATFQAATTTQWYASFQSTSGSGFSSLLTEINTNTTYTNSTGTPTTVTSMTYTISEPITRALVLFNATFTASAFSTARYAIYLNGVIVTNTNRLNAPPGSGASSSLSTQGVVSGISIGDVIDIRCSRSGSGTVTVSARSLIIMGVA